MYRLIHDDADWPDDLDRTISTHPELDEALHALDAQFAARDAQLAANDEGGSRFALAVLDDTGDTVAAAEVTGQPPATGWPSWTSPDDPSDWSFFDDV